MARIILKYTHPIQFLVVTLTYSLGAGIAHYLGAILHSSSLALGLLSVLLLQVASNLLVEYFRPATEPLIENETLHQRQRLRVMLLQLAGAVLVLVTVSMIILLYSGLLDLSSSIVFALAFLLWIAYAVPPFRLVHSGYGELILAILWAILIPALAFFLQTDGFHRLLPLVAFPFTLLALAYLLLRDFLSFASDWKYSRRTLVSRLTWQKAVPLHHFLLLGTYLLFAAAPFFGFPWSLLWPVFLTLPLAFVQIIWLQRIALGGRTLWKLLIALATAEFSLTVYFLTLTFWLH